MPPQYSGRLELTWTNKDLCLLARENGEYEWVPRSDYRVAEVRLLRDAATVGDVGPEDQRAGDNLLIRGDALGALTALTELPEFAEELVGRVRVAYLDPPFNTQQSFLQYDDALEHSVWLTMMRDRLLQIRRLLAPNGSVWVHCDDAEQAHLRVLMNEVFGADNFIATAIWERADTLRNDALRASVSHDYIIAFAAELPRWRSNRLARTAQMDAVYGNPDDDPRGPWLPASLISPAYRKSGDFVITGPSGREHQPPTGTSWRVPEQTFDELLADKRISFGRDGNGVPQRKRFLSEVGGRVLDTLWKVKDVGGNRQSKAEIKKLFPGVAAFETPKPERLMRRVIEVASDPGDLVLDCFLGSGTTAAVAHKMGRRWIGVERSEQTLDSFAIPRLTKVVAGEDSGGVTEEVGWTGGGCFRVLDVGPSMFEDDEGVVVLADWATNSELAEATGAQLGFAHEPAPPFCGRKGRSRLAVIDGLVNELVISLLVGALSEDELLTVCGTSVDDQAVAALRAARPGSRVRKIPASLLSEYQEATRWSPRTVAPLLGSGHATPAAPSGEAQPAAAAQSEPLTSTPTPPRARAVSLVDEDLLLAISSRLDLREPNVRAIETLAAELRQYFEVEERPAPFEGVIDSATGVGKTYILAGAIEYLAATATRNFAVIAPGRTILEKTVANFTAGARKSLLAGMEVQPVVITSENFATAQARSAMDDPTQVKLFIFTVQALTKPTTETGRKTHKFQEGLGRAFYEHLDDQDDLVVFADEHHCYYGPGFSAAVRDLTPYALVGLTATPHKKTPPDQIIFRYPLAAAIADRLVKTPVLVGRKDDRSDAATKLLDGVRLLDAKRETVERYCKETGAKPINPVMLVIAPSIDEAEEVAELLRSSSFAGGRYAEQILVVHSKKPDEDLAKLQSVEDDDSPVRIIVSVGMLKEGWDVKNVYVIASLRSSVSEILTEQTLGRGLRLPFGAYTNWELLDTLEVLAHERYEDLLKKARVINQAFIDHRTRAVMRRNAQGEEVVVIESQPVAVEVIPDDPDRITSGLASLGATGAGSPVIGTVEARQQEAQAQAQVVELTPRADAPQLVIPELRMSVVESHFSLADITETTEFRRLGERLARDPVGELRRIRLSAQVIETLDGLRHTELAPSRTIDRLDSPASLIPLEDAVKGVADQVLASSAVPARKGQRAQFGRLIEAFIAGLGDHAELILSGYGDRAAAGLIQLIATEQRRFATKPRYDEVLALREFKPLRHGRPVTSTDRFGAFKRGVGYVGWRRSLFEQVWFDSGTERAMANLVDDTENIDVWARLHINDLAIRWDGGNYNPDFLVVADDDRFVVETKADRDLETEIVRGKRDAARRWANHVTADPQTSERWHYLLIGETDLRQAKDDWQALVGAVA